MCLRNLKLIYLNHHCWSPKISASWVGYVLHRSVGYRRRYFTAVNKPVVIWSRNYSCLCSVMLWLLICIERPLDIININHFAQRNVIPVAAPCSGSRKMSMTKGKSARALNIREWTEYLRTSGWLTQCFCHNSSAGDGTRRSARNHNRSYLTRQHSLNRVRRVTWKSGLCQYILNVPEVKLAL